MAADQHAVLAAREEGAETVQELLPATVSLLLGTLPDRWVPSRGFITVCTELAIALADTWLMAYVAVGPDDSARTEQLQAQLDPLVGLECSRGWWADAAERDATEKDVKRPPAATPRASNGHSGDGSRGGGYQFAMHGLVTAVLRRSIASVRHSNQHASSKNTSDGSVASNASTSARSHDYVDGPDKSDVWLRFGAFWVLCALDDIVGSVIAHCARKAAMPRASRGSATRPGSGNGAGVSRPTTGSRSTTPAVGSTAGDKLAKEGVRPATGMRPGTADKAGAKDAQQPADRCMERPRLLALKHFVAAARNDAGLKACQILEACLVEVATGRTPHVATADLLALEQYHRRLMLWAEQEAGPDATEEAKKSAVTQAMKGVPAKESPEVVSAPAASRGQAASVSTGRQVKGVAPQSPNSADGMQARRSWLPKAFVHEFNAEGDEVEPEVASDDEVAMLPRSGAANIAGASYISGYVDKAQVGTAVSRSEVAAPLRPAAVAPLLLDGAESTRVARASGVGAKVSTISAPPSKTSISVPAVRRKPAPAAGGYAGPREAHVLSANVSVALS